MNEPALSAQFEEHRRHLRAVAYRMLGSISDAEDAVQESWIRLSRSDASEIENLRAWLTRVVARVSLDILRSRREEPAGVRIPDPIVDVPEASDPEAASLVASSVGLALQVVLGTLGPAERVAFVLHDVFGMPFDQIATILGRSVVATRQLASRARRRVRGTHTTPDSDVAQQRGIVDAFYAAARRGDMEGLLVLLDPDVVVRADFGALPVSAAREVRGARAVASEVMSFGRFAEFARPALVNGAAGAIALNRGRLQAIVGFTAAHGKIVAIDILADPVRLRALETATG